MPRAKRPSEVPVIADYNGGTVTLIGTDGSDGAVNAALDLLHSLRGAGRGAHYIVDGTEGTIRAVREPVFVSRLPVSVLAP